MTQIFQTQKALATQILGKISNFLGVKKQETPVVVPNTLNQGGPTTTLEQCINSSILGNTQLTPQALEAKGFQKGQFMDMNGGTHYSNSITGENLRVNTSWGNSGNTCYEYQKGNMQHTVIYDKNGKAIRGDVQIKQNDGSLQIISYEIDEKGNKVITKVEPYYNQDSFFSHDGSY